jgi:hypothetical protein
MLPVFGVCPGDRAEDGPVDASGRGTAIVNLPVFGSDNVVFYIVGPNNFYVMGSDAVTDDTVGLFHI